MLANEGDDQSGEHTLHSRAVLVDGRMFVLPHCFVGDAVELVDLPCLTGPETRSVFALDSQAGVFKVVSFDHDNEPHSIYCDGRVLHDSTVYILAPVHAVFVSIADYFSRCKDGVAGFVDLQPRAPNKAVSAVFEVAADGRHKLDERKCFALFDTFIDRLEGAGRIDDPQFAQRWGLGADGRDRDVAFGLEVLRDLVCDKLFTGYLHHLKLQPLTDAQMRKPTGTVGRPSPQAKAAKKLKQLPEVMGSAGSIASYFKPRNK